MANNFFNAGMPDIPPELRSALFQGPGAVMETPDNVSQTNMLPAAFGIGAPARNAASVRSAANLEGGTPTGGSPADVLSGSNDELMKQSLLAHLAQRAAGPSGFFRRLFSSPEAEQARQKAWLADRMLAYQMEQAKMAGKETESQETLRTAQAGHAQAQTDQIRYLLSHPELLKKSLAGEKEGRLNAKDFTSEVDRQVKAAEDAEREKFGNMTVPYSELDHEARIGDVELANKDNYPQVKLRRNYQDSRGMRDWLEMQLGKFSSNQVLAGLLKADRITLDGKSVKLTPTLRARLLGYVDAKGRKAALLKALPKENVGQPEEAIPAAGPGIMGRIFGGSESQTK